MADFQNKVAIVAGARTPFVKSGGIFSSLSMQDLGEQVLRGLVGRSGINPELIDEFVFSSVLLDPRTPNWAREIVFRAGLPKTISAHSVSNNCISGLVAINFAAESIGRGRINCAIAGGSESMSKPSLVFSEKSTDKFLRLFRARSFGEKVNAFTKFRPKDFLPRPPSVTEPSTGLTMGEHMEITAKELNITRELQDRLAYESHVNASAAIKQGLFDSEVLEIAGVKQDNLVRSDASLDKLAKLRPVFDRSEKGTLTAGNSSALTDGASAVLLMSEARAAKEGRTILAFIRDYEYAAIDPNEGLLMAPAIAVPRLLKRTGFSLKDFDLIEIHEAFAAQVLANIKAWEEGWRGNSSIGKLDRNKLNTLGGSIALGHPFAATGGRIVTTLANELKRKNFKRGLISICAAGAMAGAMILERP